MNKKTAIEKASTLRNALIAVQQLSTRDERFSVHWHIEKNSVVVTINFEFEEEST